MSEKRQIKTDFLKRFTMTEEELAKKEDARFKECQTNVENMSYWFPKVVDLPSDKLKFPQTKIVSLSKEWWKWSRSDNYTLEKIEELSQLLKEEIRDFLPNQTLFMKTGIFSNKFDFHHTIIRDRDVVGKKFLEVHYPSMLYGADTTAEVVFREMIENTEGRPTIYNGMPLHTEFRVFYDFDEKKVLGTANYWHPSIMERGLREKEDLDTYMEMKNTLEADYDAYKMVVAKMVSDLFENGCELTGKWSVDVMKNNDDFWLIDMARMEKSALVAQIDSL